MKDIKSSDQETIKAEKQTMHAFLMKELFMQGYVHFLNFHREDLESVIKLGPSHDLVSNKIRKGSQDMNASLSNDLQQAFVSELNKSKADKALKNKWLVHGCWTRRHHNTVFYIGDLLNVVIGGMDNFLTKTGQLVKSPGNYKVKY